MTEQIPSSTVSPSAAPPMPGDPLLNRIRTASRELDDVGSVPLADAARRFEHVHAELQSALSDLDDA